MWYIFFYCIVSHVKLTSNCRKLFEKILLISQVIKPLSPWSSGLIPECYGTLVTALLGADLLVSLVFYKNINIYFIF